MVKKAKQKTHKIKGKKEIYRIIIYCALILLFVLISGLTFKKLSVNQNDNNESNSNENLSFYDEETCRCVERERLRCNEGFELDLENRICKNGNDITNVILGCSKYECSGTIYEFNFENETWVIK